jgi:hypothetical protein
MRNTLIAAAWLVLANAAPADEPKPIPLDPPKVISPPVYVATPMAFERQSMYRWQYAAVDRTGHFRQRVVLDCQPWYMSNGQPYYMLPVRGRDMNTVKTP